MKEIADKIKNARERKHLTLQEISYDTKIPVSILKSIENAELDVFKAEFYARSFMKTYADFLGISLSDYELREAISPAQENEKEDISELEHDIIPARSPRQSFILVLLLLASAAVIISYRVHTFQKTDAADSEITSIEAVPVQTAVMVKAVVKSDTWIKVTCDENVVEETILLQGNEKYWKADRNMKIRIGYTKGLELYHKTSPVDEYMKLDVDEGSSGEVNEIELINESAE